MLFLLKHLVFNSSSTTWVVGLKRKLSYIHKQQSERFLLPIGTHLLTGCVEETFYGTLNAGFLLRERHGLSARPLPLSNQQQKVDDCE